MIHAYGRNRADPNGTRFFFLSVILPVVQSLGSAKAPSEPRQQIQFVLRFLGPFYHDGMYHFFYQYNPHGPAFGTGKLSWGHSISGDLVNWAFLGTALDPTSPFDADGCWSGSATVLPDGRPVILYTGRDTNTVQVQNVAFPKDPSDPLLREWHKPSCNPVIPQPADVTGNNFRDPSTAWLGRDGLWRFAVAAEVNGVGSTLIYRGADFVHWERNAAPLHASPEVPALECPDLFPVAERGTEGLDTSANGPGVRRVLKLSKMADEDYYMVGWYDDAADTFVPAEEERGGDVTKWRRIDHGHLFGAKSFFDARKKRRVLWAWVDETDGHSDDVAKGWTGIQSFPRALWLDNDGKQLVQWPVEEIETLRRKQVTLLGAVVGSGGLQEIAGIETLQADVEVAFEIPNLEEAEQLDPKWLQDPRKLCAEKGASVQGRVGPFGLIVMASGDLQEQTTIFFRVFKHDDAYKVLMCMDLTRSSTKEGVYKPVYAGFVDVDVEKDRSISLRTLIDHSVIESFGGGGRTCITARVYPEHVATCSSHLYLFNNGSDSVKVSKIEAWDLGTASVNLEDVSLPILTNVPEQGQAQP
ncbi:hypothetical protein GQ55_7G319800 [Panicum hallii var. hallii]|uniref:Glycosyl hydrolase family 32 N-terminal domain-containing protein n=1 Tax=Panicum hallii var. hallii TaxID=1504633 RepID=A0A2T7D1A4_9POAL|nr:hypothetical protein GQ55_7G319800 [Panicum hallii var. hallii]